MRLRLHLGRHTKRRKAPSKDNDMHVPPAPTFENHANVDLIPELDVTNLEVSLGFYQGIVGFSLVFERNHERFAYIRLGNAHLMLQEAAGPGRRFRTAPLAQPFGRGINFQLRVFDVDKTYQDVQKSTSPVILPLENKSYEGGPQTFYVRQFVVADPDGYLLRLYSTPVS